MSLAGLGTILARSLPPEAAHTATIKALKAGIGLPKVSPLQWNTPVKLPHAGLQLFNPVGLAAGFDKNAEVFEQMLRFGFGFVECGTVTPRPQPGNPKPRLFRLTEDAAVINRMGFNNEGLRAFSARIRHAQKRLSPVGANVGANKDSEDRIADYEAGIEAVYPYAHYITINISSPNTPGLRGLQDKGALQELLERCGAARDKAQADYGQELKDEGRFEEEEDWKPVFLKVAPDLDATAIGDIIEVLRGPGHWLSGLIVSNTTLERPDTLKSEHKSEAGGLSGAPLFVKSTRILQEFASEIIGEFDLIGAGGISSGADAYAKIRAGAHAVQLYSALVYHGPDLVAEINKDLAARLHADGFTSVEQAVGADLR
ncbi:quinone-dependent dihydroorotate dehydrogenase [Henriciella mobilis]|uniref:quinone-dependent dihydroorotate dehydrogenase n=1 Tax=Henriciella mobilis TaxID=2305467 RepID=UPI000E667102|nr:quinone-dependent dihydroorotate dehydrogenase [Henriciella mobilis]RIJ17489.1 quinone-dependent dihydroorotate dehydrogenase [Henriciella mobilis]RIJ25524.1 quinone-dependent dihydroorotate dehydrogenase [Henriciella mobilis]